MPRSWVHCYLCSQLTHGVVLLVLSLLVLGNPTGSANDTSSEVFFWIDIEPTPYLVWHACFQPLRRECARLVVPLNHLKSSEEGVGNATIALIRIPSPLGSQDPRYRGPILFNPGGPGDSGVDFLNATGDAFALALGDEFDLVSFDPRGISRSTPKISFFDVGVGRGEREVWGNHSFDLIRGGAGDEFWDIQGLNGRSVEDAWARNIVANKLAGENAGEWLGNVNTEQTAYDMLSIINAYGQKKLMYWGVSYGTVLGSTFASLFPDKVERVVLDGVVDVEDYYATQWSKNLDDTPKTMNLFFETCFTAGPQSCPLWASTPALIEANLTQIYKELITNPIPIRTPSSYGSLDYPTVKLSVFTALYSPWTEWPALAQALAALGGPQRDPEPMWQFATGNVPTFKCPCSGSCNDKGVRERDFEEQLDEGLPGVACSDGVDIPSEVASAKSIFNNLSQKSDFADIWANIPLRCAGFPKVKKGFQGPIGGNTSFPMLFIGNTADPVAPLAGVKRMSAKFPGSRVLTQDSPGHTSINGPSNCTLSHVKEYFISGVLPPEDLVCPVDSSPFAIDPNPPINPKRAIEDFFSVSDEGQRIRRAADELSRAWKPFSRGFLRGFN